MARGGHQSVYYDTYVFQLRVLVMIIFVAAQAPELVSRDLRSHVLPLYFSRPLRRLDYPAAKLGAFVLACLALLEIPLLLLYLGAIGQVGGGAAIWAQTRALIPGLLVGLAWAVLLASIGLALASLSGRRAYATGSIAICFFLSWALASLLRRGDVAERARGPARGRGSPGWSARSPCWTGCASGSAARRRDRSRRRATSGSLYGVMFLLMLAAAVGGLAARYRKAGICMSSIELRNVSRWYGNVVAINDITMTIGPGVTGLLGPERRREVHPAAPDLRVPGAVPGRADRRRRARAGATRASTGPSAWCPSVPRSTRS